MMKLMRSTPGSMLGISLEGRVLNACVVRRHGQRLEPGKTLRTELALDPLTASPELAGQEIRNKLDEAGLHGRLCAIAVPASWVFSLQLVLPDVSAEDQRSFVELQAERDLPFAPEDLVIGVGRWGEAAAMRATVLAIPRVRVNAIEQVMRAAKLRTVSITTGLPALPATAGAAQSGAAGKRRLTLLLGGRGAEMLAWVDGVAALRTVEEAGGEGQDFSLDAESIGRQIRITMGQLTPEARSGIRELAIVGEPLAAADLAEELKGPAGRLGLAVERVEAAAAGPVLFGGHVAVGVALAAAAAACPLWGRAQLYEFLPPHENKWKALSHRLSKRGTMGAIVIALAALLGFGGSFGYQAYRLSVLQSRWNAIESDVKSVEALRDNVRKYRPWFDDSVKSLQILRTLTGAFPVDGVVYAKTIKITNEEKVLCTGMSRSDTVRQQMAKQLQESPGILDMHIDVQGQPPQQQFTLSCAWRGGKSNAK